MNVWPWIIVAAVVAGLVTTLLFTIKGNLNLQKELDFARAEFRRSERDLQIANQKLLGVEKQLSFEEGMHVGRRTDALYRQLLKRYTNGERFTVMMSGAKDGGAE